MASDIRRFVFDRPDPPLHSCTAIEITVLNLTLARVIALRGLWFGTPLNREIASGSTGKQRHEQH